MEHRIDRINEKKLVGKRLQMSFANNLTFELWKSFMPHLKYIKNRTGKELYSLQIFAPGFFNHFDPHALFEKWALAEVSDFDTVPPEMETFSLKGGLNAVFLYKGDASGAASSFEYILRTWLPHSEYTLDNRPHFEILGEKYKNNDPGSEEEIWIPIKPKEK
jgi:AraC family transcriptional regulator